MRQSHSLFLGMFTKFQIRNLVKDCDSIHILSDDNYILITNYHNLILTNLKRSVNIRTNVLRISTICNLEKSKKKSQLSNPLITLGFPKTFDM